VSMKPGRKKRVAVPGAAVVVAVVADSAAVVAAAAADSAAVAVVVAAAAVDAADTNSISISIQRMIWLMSDHPFF
jgi:hypothetical protein